MKKAPCVRIVVACDNQPFKVNLIAELRKIAKA